MRNTTQFSYGRELLKIIRRIIKCNPTQGQQFGTQHLLVSYNCTSWTRQDKMFAIMKFQQRSNAATFSHAFVLTVKTLSSSEQSLFDLKYPIVKEADAGATFKDLNVSLGTKEKIVKNVISVTDKASDKICQSEKVDKVLEYNAAENKSNKIINSKFHDNGIKDSAIFYENLDEKGGNSTVTAKMHVIDKPNTEFHINVQENKFTNCNTNTELREKKVEHLTTNCTRAQEQFQEVKENDKIENAHKVINKKETKLMLTQKENEHIQDVQKDETSFSSLKSFTEITKDSINDQLLFNKNFDKKLIQEDHICTINNKNSANDKEISESITNHNNVPTRQYFVKTEIEHAKSNLINDQSSDQSIEKNLQTKIKDMNKDCFPKIVKSNNKSTHTKEKEIYNETTNLEFEDDNKQYSTSSTNITDKSLEDNMSSKPCKTRKQKTRESEKKIVPEKILRSSNITDLVMEGLMFTIRQDQDSVAVIEQRTKLEVDEVLENSEKVETEGGEKCLLNSSLLRLENLVTMIDSPCNRDEQYKNCHANSISANLSSFNNFSSNVTPNANIDYVDAETNHSNVSNYDKHNAMNHLNLYQSQWECISSDIKNNCNNYSPGNLVARDEHLIRWQDGDSDQQKKCKNDRIMIKQEEIASKIKKISTELQDTNSLTIKNYDQKEMNKYNESMEDDKSNFSHLLLNQNEPEVNVPRIVSNKAITIEQMPPALQNVVRHTCRSQRFPSTTSSGILEQNEQEMQCTSLTKGRTYEADISLEGKCVDSNKTNKSLSIKRNAINSEIKSNNEKSCIIMDKDVSERNQVYGCVKSSKEKIETRRTLRNSSPSKHGLPRKLQDITEEFYYDLLHIHNKDKAIRQKCLKQKQRSLSNFDDMKNSGKVRIEMLKFIQDITEGAKVVVKRLNIDNKSNPLAKNSNLI
ncbi:hypothetical protein PUN28_013374 [Cardiocondyla obscurior]